MDNIRLHRYKKSDREEVFTFLGLAYPDTVRNRLIKQWDWKYDSNPFNYDLEPYIILAKKGNKIVGMMGDIPLRVSICGEIYWITNGSDLAVHPDHRRQGLAKNIIEQNMIDHPLNISWLNKISRRAVSTLSTYYCHRLSNWVKIINYSKVFRQMTGKNLSPRWCDLFASGINKITRPLKRPQSSSDITIARMTNFDERAYDLWQKIQGDYPVLIVRDLQYLKWRYLDRPDVSYIMIAATKGTDLAGYMIFRLGEKRGMQIGYLVDFLVEGKSPLVFSLLVEKAVSCLIKESADVISCQTTTGFGRWVLYRHGFYPWRWGTSGYFYSRVHMPDQTPPLPQYAKIFGDVRQWYITMGDGDLELSF